MGRAAFIDRDGSIIEDVGYLNDPNKIKFLPRVAKAIKLLNEYGFKVIVTTNQSGVARGYFTEERVKEINKQIQELLAKQGALIDKIYYCPHHTEGIIEEYRKDCYCRKPNPGMIEKAAREFDIDLKSSFVIGDKSSDIEAGHKAGCRTILIRRESLSNRGKEVASKSDYIATNLHEAVKWLIDSTVKVSL